MGGKFSPKGLISRDMEVRRGSRIGKGRPGGRLKRKYGKRERGLGKSG